MTADVVHGAEPLAPSVAHTGSFQSSPSPTDFRLADVELKLVKSQ